MAIGLIATIWRSRSSRAARVLLVWVVTYPVGDIVSEHFCGHALRSSPGLCGLILLGAVGAVTTGTWLWRRSRRTAWVAGCVMAVAVIVMNVRFLHCFFGKYNDRPRVYHGYHVDLLKACEWLRPRLGQVDAVFCTKYATNVPYIVSLVGLAYDPDQWFRDVREMHTIDSWDVYT